MDDELLDDILTAERQIRRQIDAAKEESAAHLQRLRQEFEEDLQNESRQLQGKVQEVQCRAEETAQEEAEALLAAARTFSERLDHLSPEELDRVVRRELHRILPEGAE